MNNTVPKKSYRILIVDDNPNNLFTLKEALSQLPDVEIIEAESGEEALISTLEYDIQLILLDVQMPGMDGFETARHLRLTEKTKDIPIIFITAVYKSEEFIQKGYQTGAIDYLTKPIDDNLLLNRVNLYKRLSFRERELKAAMRALKENEAILIQQSRMAVMGQMLGAIAHQWRQPLNALSLLLMDIKESYDYNELNENNLNLILRQSTQLLQFLSKTIDDFRNFYKPDKQKIRLKLDETIYDVIAMTRGNLENNRITVNIDCYNAEPNQLTLYSYPTELKQVFINIICNACDAIIERQKNDSAFEGRITIRVIPQKELMLVQIADNGGGVPEDILNQIFDPYFTTKPQMQGTGIGLYMSKMIIEQHLCGSLTVKNTEDGAAFLISLNRCAETL
jgi:C4-dicarboxylate-specific signal transduction histidine kinase